MRHKRCASFFVCSAIELTERIEAATGMPVFGYRMWFPTELVGWNWSNSLPRLVQNHNDICEGDH